jgi:pimeloyl-ACP methyl ester carboxylesterase
MVDDDWQRAEHEDRTFVYLDSGDGPLVVLFHGFPDHPLSWDGIRTALVEAGYRAVAPFLRGYHPDTVVEGRGYSPVEIGDDAVALLDALGAESATLVGHDWGASVAYSAATLAPARVDRVVTAGIPHPSAFKPSPRLAWFGRHFVAFKMPWAEAMSRRNHFAYIEGLYRRWSPDWSGPERDAAVARVKEAFADPTVLHHALGYYRDFSTKRPEVLERPLESKALIVGGGGETALLAAYESSCTFVTEPCEVVLVPGAGHWPHREDEPFFIERLLAFLGS